MNLKFYISTVCVFVVSLSFITPSFALKDKSGQRTEVVMRTIGHEVLLAHGDSTSRVLPVEQIYDRYIIEFDTKFEFQSSKLISAIDSVVKTTDIATHYIVEMLNADTEEVIYSYEVDGAVDFTRIPCGTRAQPLAAYSLHFTILKAGDSAMLIPPSTTADLRGLSAEHANNRSPILWAIPFFLLIGIAMYFYQKESDVSTNTHLIEIGDYLFDPRNMTLSLADHQVELTSKESDLLSLLHSSANATVERDDILRNVWGDKGDYVGRTLDVFISKLRKKLEGDTSVKIANIRGVGYRLVC